jgi:hypothetical protein
MFKKGHGNVANYSSSLLAISLLAFRCPKFNVFGDPLWQYIISWDENINKILTCGIIMYDNRSSYLRLASVMVQVFKIGSDFGSANVDKTR